MSTKSRKVMLINVTHAEESRVAIVSDGVLEAFEIETVDHKSRKGNIYKGRVESVQPALQAAFVDIGDARGAFLPLDEVNFKVHPSRKENGRGRIERHLARGQEVLVQVVRDAFGTKPPTLSTYFSLPGRHLVLTPFSESAGISRKLTDKQRERLRKIVDSLPLPDGFGVIVRTAGASATKTEFQRDLRYLLRLWEKIDRAAKEVRPPALIYQERSLVMRAMRDLYTPDIEEILVDDEATCREVLDYFEVVAPAKKKTVRLYEGQRPIFNKYNLEEQIENIFRRRVPLPSGGAIIFDTTEALTSIDVNSGKMKREGHIEDTALKANLEAAEEICRQLRLRDLGGLIVIDFIDMRSSKNVRQVEKAMREGLKKDKARYDVTRISQLGLMEISRERLNAQKSSLRYTDCPTCDGTGSVKTIEAAALQALRRLQTRVVRGDLAEVVLTLPADVADYILNHKRTDLARWEERYGTHIVVHGDAELRRDESEINVVRRERAAAEAPIVAPPTTGEILAEIDEEEAAEPEPEPDEEAGEAGTAKKKRRRRRRGGRKHRRRGAGERESAEEEPAAGEAAEGGAAAESAPAPEGEAQAGEAESGAEPVAAEGSGNGNGETPGRRRRRRRRRRRGSASAAEAPAEAPNGLAAAPLAAPVAAPPEPADAPTPRLRWWRALIEGISQGS